MGFTDWLTSSDPQGGGWTAATGVAAPLPANAGQDYTEFTGELISQNTPAPAPTPSLVGLFGIGESYMKQMMSPIKPKEEDVCQWWNLTCKAGKAVQATAGFFQSTLLKALAIIVIVAIVGIFVMSYAQAKGTQAA